ncbi:MULTISPECIES: TetR/AcrR family transcriptional regulator [Rhodococcus]|nr:MULTISPECIES: TetR/AcrR family transcriptional regulator [Rhodococcus]RZL24935.1 MAG: TetR/AcrR family transcriptional regulator [Rhodococcus sp. (in: high G+C Gram-positive bacteria)]
MTSRDMQILKVAADLFYEKGYGGVAVDEIGSTAGLTGPAIYRHFKGKGEILAALFDQAIDGILSATGNISSDPFQDLEHRVRAHARFVLNEHKLASVWIREGRSLSDEHRKRLRRREISYMNQWIDCISRCYPDMDAKQAEVAALTALGALNSVSNWPKAPLSLTNIEDEISEFVLKGLRRP